LKKKLKTNKENGPKLQEIDEMDYVPSSAPTLKAQSASLVQGH
jgi:hypothetical protein